MVAGIEAFWPEDKTVATGMTTFEKANGMELVQAKLRELAPVNDAQRQLLARAQQISGELIQFRWLLIEQTQNALPKSFLVMVLFWLTMLHMSFGPVRAPEHDGDYRAAHLRPVGVRCNFSHFGNEPSAVGRNQSLQRATAQGAGTSRPVAAKTSWKHQTIKCGGLMTWRSSSHSTGQRPRVILQLWSMQRRLERLVAEYKAYPVQLVPQDRIWLVSDTDAASSGASRMWTRCPHIIGQ